MLKYNFSQVADQKNPLIQVDEAISFGPDFFERAKELIISVEKANVTGQIFYDEPFVFAQMHVVADITVPSSRSLNSVPLKLDFKFLEAYTKETPSQEDLEAIDTIIELEDDLIDLQTAVEDHLLLHIPLQNLTKEELEQDLMPKGDDWEVVSESKFLEQQKQEQVTKINPAFEKLKGLFPASEDSATDDENN
ncbi:hypothetical protein FC62_GL001373 [Amylolactobacillus amylotrophicus DSM 20534]|uniref:Uncharacterized protein n=3 Tax=Amylolactobacillus TaxID=2767876 RepID=A0A1L6XAH6_9LACO|nr:MULTISPECIES: DUF177 domain-containing protein [Amylolactobacillus]APT17976.1 hypothetical protein LA20533_00960 [Amylolactobacillus amylophilus DSM 20533 = JCM 1125]KRK37258.1 hypothetical protein FC62_GL001373 [Amylolactobacillus amylotrophicus DSM 20534]KRM41657.1 hypothetical protein FD40_GL001219 [Amylolactobacillus amylophilus DSM 20533 = JCM 1125]GED80744.1 DNA-binding protein [Amylolactobacillus amylophilus]